MQECRSVLRDAVEWTAYAHYMMTDPALQMIWWEQDDPAGKALFHEKFVHKKKFTVFAGQEELHEKFELSEAGRTLRLSRCTAGSYTPTLRQNGECRSTIQGSLTKGHGQ